METSKDSFVFLNPEIELQVTRPFYIRSHQLVTPMDELIRYRKDYDPNYPYLFSRKVFEEWAAMLNKKDLIDGGMNWKAIPLIDSRSEWQEGINLQVPTLLASTKAAVLHGYCSDAANENARQVLMQLMENKQQFHGWNVTNVSMKLWFLDWQSGAFDLNINLNVGQQTISAVGLRSLCNLGRSVLRQVFFPDAPLGTSEEDALKFEANRIGELLYETCRRVLNLAELIDPPARNTGIWTKIYWDLGHFACVRYSNQHKPGYLQMKLGDLENALNFFVASDSGKYIEGDANSKEEVTHYVCGYGGCAVLVDESIINWRQTHASMKSLWKLTLFYFSGLGKLNYTLSKLSMRAGRTKSYVELMDIQEFREFAEYRLRLLVFINETQYGINSDNSFDRDVFENYWKALKGGELSDIVLEQIGQIGEYCHGRKEQERAKLGVRLSLLAAALTVWYAGAGMIWDLYTFNSSNSPCKCKIGWAWEIILISLVAIVIPFVGSSVVLRVPLTLIVRAAKRTKAAYAKLRHWRKEMQKIED